MLPGVLLGIYAQSSIKANVAKYSQVSTLDGITGAQVARRLLDVQGLQGVAVESTPGMLSDHYDPRSKVLRLSQDVYFTPSVAAAGIAAHEAGHALQDAEDYFPLEARTYIVPLVQLASQIAPWLFIAGMMLEYSTLVWIGVILFGSSSFFALRCAARMPGAADGNPRILAAPRSIQRDLGKIRSARRMLRPFERQDADGAQRYSVGFALITKLDDPTAYARRKDAAAKAGNFRAPDK